MRKRNEYKWHRLLFELVHQQVVNEIDELDLKKPWEVLDKIINPMKKEQIFGEAFLDEVFQDSIYHLQAVDIFEQKRDRGGML